MVVFFKWIFHRIIYARRTLLQQVCYAPSKLKEGKKFSLLQLHRQGARLSDWLSGAAYRIGQLEKPVTDMPAAKLAKQFRPEIVEIISEGKKRNSIEALEELIQLPPPGLFNMKRIKGLGGEGLMG